MHDSYALYVLLFSLVLSIGLKAITADSGGETDLVVPLELTGDDAVHLLQVLRRSGRRRGQRSLRHSERHHFKKDEDNLFLMLPAFGKELYLQLERDAGFLSQDFVIEEKDGKRTTQLTHIPVNQLCFYAGRVFNHSNSFASLSTCGGLTGLVQIGDDSMFIEPVNAGQDSFSGVEHKVVRQKRSPKSSSEMHPKYCEIIQVTVSPKKPYLIPPLRGKQDGSFDVSGDWFGVAV